MGFLVNKFHVNLLQYAHWFMLIRISQIKDHYISVDQSIYSTYIVEKYLDNSTVKTSTKLYNTNFPYDMIFTKAYVSTSDDQADNFTREINVRYRVCIGSLIYLSYKRVDFIFQYTS